MRAFLETIPDHYSVLGLDRRCNASQVRNAYRLLAKRFHPDVNAGCAEASASFREVTTAYETLVDSARRRAYDADLESQEIPPGPQRVGRIEKSIAQDIRLRIEEFLNGTELEVQVRDPANPNGLETYPLSVPAGTAPGTRFRILRAEPFAGGFVVVRVRALPSARFKIRGSDVCCDLRIPAKTAERGGMEWVQGISGARLRVQVPVGASRGELVRVAGEGMPKARGGRGDLLVRVTYRPDVKISRQPRR